MNDSLHNTLPCPDCGGPCFPSSEALWSDDRPEEYCKACGCLLRVFVDDGDPDTGATASARVVEHSGDVVARLLRENAELRCNWHGEKNRVDELKGEIEEHRDRAQSLTSLLEESLADFVKTEEGAPLLRAFTSYRKTMQARLATAAERVELSTERARRLNAENIGLRQRLESRNRTITRLTSMCRTRAAQLEQTEHWLGEMSARAQELRRRLRKRAPRVETIDELSQDIAAFVYRTLEDHEHFGETWTWATTEQRRTLIGEWRVHVEDTLASIEGVASCDALAREINAQIDSGEFDGGSIVIERDIVGRCVLAYVKQLAGERSEGCRVLAPAPVVVLLRETKG